MQRVGLQGLARGLARHAVEQPGAEKIDHDRNHDHAEGGMIRDVHSVRVRETDEGEIVNFHCHVDPALTVQAVHEKVDEVERALRGRSPSIKRVIGHAEPRG